MNNDKLYELKRDIYTPVYFIPAGIRKTEQEWNDKLGEFNMKWESMWFIDLSQKDEHEEVNELNELVNSVFKKYGLNSLTYKDAAKEIAEKWLEQNKCIPITKLTQ